MRINWKNLVTSLVLEALMFVSPVGLDMLGVLGEYLVEAQRIQVEASI